jgi:hypothetical protein
MLDLAQMIEAEGSTLGGLLTDYLALPESD